MANFGPGILIVPNEVFDSQGATIASANGAFLAGGIMLGAGECGAILLNGILCVGNRPGSTITTVPIYNPDLSLRATAVPFTPTGFWSARCSMTSDYESTFYASINDASFTALVRSFSTLGVTGPTTWHLDSGGASGPISLALSEDSTQFYYARYNVANVPIKAWNLGSDTTGGTLVAAVAGTSFGQDLLRLPGSSDFIILASTAGPVFTVRRYSSTGTLLKSYPLTGITHEASPTRLAVDLGQTGTFWVRTFNDLSSATTGFIQFDVSTGAVVTAFTVNTSSNFGSGEVPFSCPFFAWSASGSDLFIGSETVVPLKRVRRVPLPVLPGNARQTIGRVELQFAAGAGLASSSSQPPKWMLAVSFNNGRTFQTERQMSAGLTGQYYVRALANSFGTGRYPVLDLSCTDDFNSVLTDVFVTMEPQTG